MARLFDIVSGPSLRELDLATFDAMPEQGGRLQFIRRIIFVVPGPSRTSRKQEFYAKVITVSRTRSWDEFIIIGTGGFHAVSPYWKQQEMGASGEDWFRATFNTQTRKGVLEVVESRGWKDIPAKGTIALQVHGGIFPIEKMIQVAVRCSSDDLANRMRIAIGRIIREEKLLDEVPGLESYTRAGIQFSLPLEGVKNVVRILEERLREHEFLRGATVEAEWYEPVRSLVEPQRGET